MSSRDNIKAKATIIEALGDGAYRAELANGHRCIVRSSNEAHLAPGELVPIEFHPYDLSRGRIVQ